LLDPGYWQRKRIRRTFYDDATDCETVESGERVKLKVEVGFNLIQLRVKAGRSSVVYEVLVFRQKGAQAEADVDDFVCDGIYENGVQDLITHQIRGAGIQYALLADDSTDYYNLWVNELREVIACNARLYLQNPAYTVADVQVLSIMAAAGGGVGADVTYTFTGRALRYFSFHARTSSAFVLT